MILDIRPNGADMTDNTALNLALGHDPEGPGHPGWCFQLQAGKKRLRQGKIAVLHYGFEHSAEGEWGHIVGVERLLQAEALVLRYEAALFYFKGLAFEAEMEGSCGCCGRAVPVLHFLYERVPA